MESVKRVVLPATVPVSASASRDLRRGEHLEIKRLGLPCQEHGRVSKVKEHSLGQYARLLDLLHGRVKSVEWIERQQPEDAGSQLLPGNV